MQLITFKPKNTTKKLLSVVKDRSGDILSYRYGLNPKEPTRQTLESIGGKYGITRERVRQIENFSLNSIRKSDAYEEIQDVLLELKKEIDNRGKIVHEEEFLNSLAKDEVTKNQIHFLLVVAPTFVKIKEDNDFYHRWTTDTSFAEKVQEALNGLHGEIEKDDLITEKDVLSYFIKQAKQVGADDHSDESILRDWLKISKKIDKNALGEWGRVSSSNIRPRGVRDLAFLVLRKHGSPMHFTEVADDISSVFGKKAHPQTTHNELIKDGRFVLVGRGLYGLTDWGYSTGTVRDVIKNILDQSGSLDKDEIIKRVLKERYVKDNTILVNLQDRKYFKKDRSGRYLLI